MNASPVIQAGSERPERKKSSPVWTWRLAAMPIPSTTAKYTARIAKSTAPACTRNTLHLPNLGTVPTVNDSLRESS